jgi:RNA-directed DNA polymerase
MLIEYLSKNMLLDPSYIKSVAVTASKRYKKATIKKKDGSDRLIFQPSRELKAMQRVINKDILCKLPMHASVYSYKIGTNLRDHILAHKNGNFITRLDFKNFFNSINKEDVIKFISDNKNFLGTDWNDTDTNLLVMLACFRGTLTIGASTSPTLSNCICYQLDNKLSVLCRELRVVYSRYADDLYFSTNEPNVLFGMPQQVIKIVRSIDYPRNLWLNTKKTIHTSKKRLRKVTGLVLTPDGKVSIGRNKKREIRSRIHNWDNLEEDARLSLKGYLAFVSSVEPNLINRLCMKFGSDKIYGIIRYGQIQEP